MEKIDELKEKILSEMRVKKMEKGFVWIFQQYNTFKCELEPPLRNIFESCMSELCENGVFLRESHTNMPAYRLTEYGEKIVYK